MRWLLSLAVAGALACPSPAPALDVTFTGLVVDTCTIALTTPGVMSLSGSGTILATDNGGLAVPATVSVVSIGLNTISLSPPTLETYPPSYNPAGQTLQLSTSGLLNNLFTALGISGLIGLIPATNLLIDMRITNPNGFKQGTYVAKTVLTCS